MKKIIKNKGIVIKVQDYLENAVIATILTENGKQSYLIKGAKKVKEGTTLTFDETLLKAVVKEKFNVT